MRRLNAVLEEYQKIYLPVKEPDVKVKLTKIHNTIESQFLESFNADFYFLGKKYDILKLIPYFWNPLVIQTNFLRPSLTLHGSDV